LRELNDTRNEGLNIRAEFAHEKRQETEIQFFKPLPVDSDDESTKEELSAFRAPFTIQWDRPNDDVHEKVSQFERKKEKMSYETHKKIEKMKQLAAKMSQNYNADTVRKNFR
jgi:hypothetical protein